MLSYDNYNQITETPEAHLGFLKKIGDLIDREKPDSPNALFSTLSKNISIGGKPFSEARHLVVTGTNSDIWSRELNADKNDYKKHECKAGIVAQTKKIMAIDDKYDLAYFTGGYEQMKQDVEIQHLDYDSYNDLIKTPEAHLAFLQKVGDLIDQEKPDSPNALLRMLGKKISIDGQPFNPTRHFKYMENHSDEWDFAITDTKNFNVRPTDDTVKVGIVQKTEKIMAIDKTYHLAHYTHGYKQMHEDLEKRGLLKQDQELELDGGNRPSDRLAQAPAQSAQNKAGL